MEELTWLILVIWLIMVIYYFKSKNTIMGGTGGAIGVFFAITLIDDANWLGFILVPFNLYVIYEAIIGEGRKK